MDFRDGLVLLGRSTFTRAVADPDSPAALPVVIRMGRGESGWIGYESLNVPVAELPTAPGRDLLPGAAVEAALRDRIRPAGGTRDAEDAEAARRQPPRPVVLLPDRTPARALPLRDRERGHRMAPWPDAGSSGSTGAAPSPMWWAAAPTAV
ncbi:hypothetical protein [Streptomyces sp. SM11]|uniref:hypothetical protein n=1 Tax=Streptomyces sp. SM11 TaxID=565557 RepID=UPI0035BC475B